MTRQTRTQNRRALLSAMGTAAAGVALASVPARAQDASKAAAPAGSAPAAFAAARHTEDAWLDTLPGKHRVIIDVAPVAGGSEALLYANNLFTANKSGYGLEDKDVATVVCFRHNATIFGYNDKMWAKYGKALADIPDPKDKTKVLKAAGQQVDGFGQLQDDGTTTCGNWIYSGFYPADDSNKAAARDNKDPSGLGFHPGWGWAWPANRRILYNRCSTRPDGSRCSASRSITGFSRVRWASPPTTARSSTRWCRSASAPR